jgi:Flp pilus assembly pilin Flp
MKLMLRLWSDEAGFVISSELILIAALVVIGLLTGLATVRDQIVQELGDTADAISELQQEYQWLGTTGHTSSVAGSLFNDLADFCEAGANASDQTATTPPQCILVNVGAADEE